MFSLDIQTPQNTSNVRSGSWGGRLDWKKNIITSVEPDEADEMVDEDVEVTIGTTCGQQVAFRRFARRRP